MTNNVGSGGFRPSLVTTSQDVTPEASFLASEHLMAKRGGITVDASSVGPDADGNKILLAGTVMGYVVSTGKFVAYDNTNTADEGDSAAGFLFESINLKDGDVITGMLVHGAVLGSRCSGLDADAMDDFAGRIVVQ